MKKKYYSDLRPLSEIKNYSTCKYCKAKIFWAVTESGKSIPVEYDEKISYLFDGIARVYFETSLMRSHLATCPFAKFFKTF